MQNIQYIRYIENEKLLKKFDDLWENISSNFRTELQKYIKEKTRERLSTIRVSERVYEKSVIAIALYQAQHAAYYKRGLKPKTQKEIGEIFGISHMTISRGNI